MIRTILHINILTLLLVFSANAQDETWFTDITEEAGLSPTAGSRIVCADINGDNYPDLLWGTGKAGFNHFYLFLNVPDTENPGQRKFIDYTDESGINKNRDPEKEDRIIDVAALVDVDNDGDLDLANSIYYHRLQYYRPYDEKDPGDRAEVYLNDGSGKFTLMENNGLHDINVIDSLPSGLVNATGLAFLDYDYDGNLDLYMATWFSDYKSNLEINNFGYKMKDLLFKGNGDGSFTMVQDPAINSVTQPMYGVNVTDWDNDGWQDILTSAYCRSGGSLFKNNRDGTFSDYTNQSGYTGQLLGGDHGQPLCNWEAQPGDFDNDGDMDLLQVSTHGGNNDGEGRTHVAINLGPEESYRLVWDLERLERDAPNTGTHFGDQGGCWIDLDNDGRLDIAVGCMGYINQQSGTNVQGQSRLYICRQNENGYFKDISKELGIFETMKEAHSMEPCDFDLDGDNDLIFSRQVSDGQGGDKMLVTLLRNDISNDKNWISVKLSPPASANQCALGARIRAFSGGLSQIRELQAGMGHFSGQQPFIKNFGLGARNYIDSIIVHWPNSGLQKTTIYNPPLNTIIELGENGLIGPVNTTGEPVAIIGADIPVIRKHATPVNTTEAISFNILNFGQKDLNVSSLAIKGGAESYFEITGNKSFTVQPGGQYEVTLSFTPDERRIYEGTLEIQSDAANQPLKIMDIHATGFDSAPVIAFDNTLINFDSLFLGENKSLSLAIKNIGEETLEISNLMIENDAKGAFSLPEDKSFSVEPGEEKFATVEITAESGFKFTEIINYTAVLKIESNAYNQDTNEIALLAVVNGPAPEFEASPSTAFFAPAEVGGQSDWDITLKNEGNAGLTVYKKEYKDVPDGIFSMEGDFPINIEAGGEYELHLVFKPQEAEKYRGELILTSNAYKDSIVSINLRGNGQEPSSVEDISEFERCVILKPNPAGDRLFIELPDAAGSKLLKIYITDINGAPLRDIPVASLMEGREIEVSLKGLPSGAYYIIFELPEEIASRRFLISR